MNSLKQVGREINNPLFAEKFSTYHQFAVHAHDVLRNEESFSNKDLSQATNHIERLRNKFQWGSCTDAQMAHNAYTAWQEILAENPIQGLEKLPRTVVFSLDLYATDRKDLKKKYSIQDLEEWTAYVWGTARVIYRSIMWLPQNIADLKTTLKDTDMVITQDTNLEAVVEKYWADHEGIKIVPDLWSESIMSIIENNDLVMNQLMITPTSVEITSWAKEALEKGVTWLVHSGTNFFGDQSYEIDWQIVYDRWVLMRWVKALIEWKTTWISLQEHNIDPENLKKMEIWRSVLDFTRRIYKRNIQQRSDMLYGLAEILTQWKVIEQPNELFNYLEEEKNAHWFSLEKQEDNIWHNARWKLSKYVKIALQDIKWQLGVPTTIDWYDVSNTDETILHHTPQEAPDDFVEYVWVLDKTHMSSYFK